MMIDHLSHTITEVGGSNKSVQFEVIILDKNKIYHKFNWQVEKYTLNGRIIKRLLANHNGIKPYSSWKLNLIIQPKFLFRNN